MLRARPDDPRLLELMGYSLLQMRQPEEAVPVLQRTVERNPTAPGPRLALGRAYLQTGDFAAAIPLIEGQLADDQDGSLHVQLARAYAGLGKREKSAELLEQSQELQRAAEQRSEAAAQRTITAPK
jgi:predicted Zn-dependent protease